VPFGDQTARINDRLDSEQLELRAMPSASVSMAWAAGATVEGQYQAISVRLSQPAIDPVTVTLSSRPGSTVDETDFFLNRSAVVIEPGWTMATVIATFWDDAAVETDETFVVGIDYADGAQVLHGQSEFVGLVRNSSAGSSAVGTSSGDSSDGAGSGGDGEPLQPPPDDNRILVNFWTRPVRPTKGIGWNPHWF
jgi:hypothetical protein